MHRHLKKNLDIEALRALAIGFTILAHIAIVLSPTTAYWRVLAHARFGSGVDLFFCISGFIITRSILPELPTRPSLGAFTGLAFPFWARRAQRLLPAALFWIVIALVATGIVGGDGVFPSLADQMRAASAAAFQYFNGYWLTCRANNTCGSLGAYWSLSLENQFYFLLPIAAAILTRRWLPLLFLAGFLVQVGMPRNITQPETLQAWVFRTDAICLGVLLAFWTERASYQTLMPTFLRSRGWAAAVFLVLCYLLAVFTDPTPWLQAQTGAVAVVSVALVWIASYDQGFLVSRAWTRTVVSYIGSRSYSIYLCHLFVLYVVRDVWTRRGWLDGHHDAAAVVWFIALTWLLAEASYRFVERPFLPRRRPAVEAPVAHTIG
ncbi:acyltransferase [Bacillus sp. NP157]|nr:acyltransferase [Bacillus sp. NP157]